MWSTVLTPIRLVVKCEGTEERDIDDEIKGGKGTDDGDMDAHMRTGHGGMVHHEDMT